MRTKYKNLSKHTAFRFVNKGLSVAFLSSILLFQSCGNDANDEIASVELQNNEVSLELRGATEQLNNSQLYVFKGTSPFNFEKKQLNVNVIPAIGATPGKLQTNMAAGTWKLILLTSDENIATKMTEPAYNGSFTNSPMFTMSSVTVGTKTYLQDVPETLYYSVLEDATSRKLVTINANQNKTVNAKLTRKVAKIRFILESYAGFDIPGTPGFQADKAYIELLNIIPTINWNGRLASAAVTNPLMHKQLKFTSAVAPALPKADTLQFLIPACGGTDDFDDSTQLPSTYKPKFKISMPLNGAEYFGKSSTPIEIGFTPQANKIIQVKIKFSGQPDTDLNVKFEVEEWKTHIEQPEEIL